MDFLNKLYSKAIFSDASALNVNAFDLGEDMISADLNEPVVNRLGTATGTIGSLNIVVGVDVSISVLKTRPVFKEYCNRILKNGYIGGTLTLYDDVNTPYTLKDISLTLKSIPSINGTKPDVTFVVQGNLEVNSDALTL